MKVSAAKWLVGAVAGSLGCAAFVAACGFDGEGTRDPGDSGAPDTGLAPVDATLPMLVDGALVDGAESGPGCNAALATDAVNCGRCGHSCLGGTCAAGICQPVTLATRSRPYDIAIDTTNVYWTDKGGGALLPNVSTAPKTGGTARFITQATSTIGDPTALVIASPGRVVFTDLNGNLIFSCAQPGTACQDVHSITLESGADGVAWNGTSIYWANTNSGNIRRADSLLQSDVIFVPTRSLPQRIVANAANVFWTVFNGIETVPVAGAPLSVYGSSSQPRDLAIDVAFIYFVNATEVRRLTHALGGELLVGTGTDIQRVAVDASGIYFTDRGAGGRVLRCPLAGCATGQQPDVLATGESGVLAIATDATQVFWTNELAVSGTVRRVAK